MRKHLVLVALLALATAGPAIAGGGGGTGYPNDGSTAFGGATVTKHGAVLVANTGNTSTTDDFSGVTVPVPTGLTFGQITELSTQFNVTDDDCGAGSPRFQIRVGGKNVFVALGPAGTLTGCAKNTWLSSGDLTEATAAECRVDTSQFTGGTQCSSWADAVALLGSQAVQGVSLVVDASWTGSTNPAFADKEQTVLVRHVSLNGKAYFTGKQTQRPKTNPAKLCKAQLAEMGSKSAFNELWAVNGRSNGFGKCVSAVAKARNAGATQEQILAAIASCRAKGLKGAALGACVASRDGVAATLTERQEQRKAKSRRGNG
jgi:hypothetical protein